ncbi:MAG: UDP-N-acetylmuramoyl-L-alanyl-D-glutamate--2,6-diaminopimelate ligase [Pseudomonadota bacterium]
MNSSRSLHELLAGYCDAVPVQPVTGIQLDSRKVNPGELFIALRGQVVDGRRCVAEAAELGAIAAVVEDQVVEDSPGIPQFVVPHLRQHVCELAGRFYAHPSRTMHVIAVTGTNGKTTVANLTAQMARLCGYDCGVIGTLGSALDGSINPALNTTPDPLGLQRTIADWSQQALPFLSLEASSHALDQGRLNAIDIDTAVFTNLTRDHLDYHGDMRRYAEAKAKLFRFKSLRAAVINGDDPHAALFEEGLTDSAKLLRYGRERDGLDVSVGEVKGTRDGLSFPIKTPWGAAKLQCPLLGSFNAMNVAAAFTACLQAGLPFDDLAMAVKKLAPISGRMDPLRVPGAPLVVVDYAHTPDALWQVLSVLKEQCSGELIAVFGCGGDRDRGKRALMGEAVSRVADRAVLTSDNPRNEDPTAILKDIEAGMSCPYLVIEDRAAAIDEAIRDSSPNDCVLIAGKGHEDYQIVGADRLEFSDLSYAQQVLAEVAA